MCFCFILGSSTTPAKPKTVAATEPEFFTPSAGPPVKKRKVSPRPTELSLRERVFDGNAILQDIRGYACAKSCPFDHCQKLCADVTLILHVREQIFGAIDNPRTSATRKNFVFETLNDNKIVDNDGKTKWRYFIGHIEICLRAYYHITAVSKMMLSRLKTRISVEQKFFVSDAIPLGVKAGGSRRNWKKDQGHALAWLRGMAKRLGQCIPNANETRLPFGRKKQVFAYYVAEMKLRGIKPCKYGTFCARWAEDEKCSTIRLCKKKGTFAQCDDCADFATQLGNAKGAMAAKKVKAQWNVHVKRIMKCREIYYDHRDQAFAYPDKLLCCIADIMDQAKTTIPHFKRANKSMSSKWWLRQCLMGVKVHGHRMDHYIAHSRVGTGGGSNFTIECILRTLRKLEAENYKGGKLPPKLYLHMDNCSGDNKNYTILGFCNFLVVAEGVFEQVKVGFLPVGHTHEDIDQ